MVTPSIPHFPGHLGEGRHHPHILDLPAVPTAAHLPAHQKDPLSLSSPATGTGILSSQPEENPHWWNANMV